MVMTFAETTVGAANAMSAASADPTPRMDAQDGVFLRSISAISL
jgi:hypothetical protein